MRALPALAFVLLLLLSASATAARGDETQMITRGRIEARVHSPWPKQLNKGYAPVFVELENRDDRERVVTVLMSGNDWSCDRRIEQTLSLAAGERAKLELHGLAKGNWESFFVVKVDVQGGDSAFFNAAAHSGSATQYRAVLAVGPRDVLDSDVQLWIEGVSTIDVNTGYTPPGTTTTTTFDNVQIGFANFEGLPSSPIPYTSLDAVVIDTSDGLPDEGALAPMLAWVRNGGTLILSGPDAASVARSRPSLATWLEERFERRVNLAATGEYLRSCYACGLGRVIVAASESFLADPVLQSVVREAAQLDDGPAPREGAGSRSTAVTPSLDGIGEVPYRVFALLLVVFAILIGPVNFIWVRRTRRPVLLLATIPIISGVSSVALLAYGILIQGLDVKTSSHSVTMLDQREHRSACIEKRILYAGSAPSDGLKPEPGTSVHPVLDNFGSGGRQRLRLNIDRTGGTRLRADYLPTRSTVMQVLCTERAERARLDVTTDSGVLQVTNNLGVALQRLLLRDLDGEYHLLDTPLAPGATASLSPVPEDDLAAWLETMRRPMSMSRELEITRSESGVQQALPRACYAARLETNPFGDACGINVTAFGGSHSLFGVLATDAEDWR